jgi:hypothetical protein
MYHRLSTVIVFLVICFSPAVQAGPIELQVDQSQSSVEVELCVTSLFTVCESDTSPVAGTFIVALDCPIAPSSVSVHDFALSLTEDINLVLNFSIFGELASTGSNVGLTYADPGNPLAPVPLVGDTFMVTGVPAEAEGQLTYVATGAVCTMLDLLGFLCTDTVDLSTVALDPINIGGTLTVSGDDVTLTLGIGVSGPVLPDAPDVAVMSMMAVIVAHGMVPATWPPGDLTGDDIVDLADLPPFIDCFLGPDIPATGVCQCADLDEDYDVDLEDFAVFQNGFGTP